MLNKPLEIIPTKQQIKKAKSREAEMTALFLEHYGREHLHNSITEGDGMLAGLVGEELFRDYYGFLRSQGAAIFHYDVLDPEVLGRIEVKTKRCTSAPKPHYNCSVAASNSEQQCDYYAFVRVLSDFSKGWLLGLLPKDLFYEKALFYKRGQKDPTGFGGWRFKWDCFNLPVRELLQAPLVTSGFDQYDYRPATHSGFTPDVILKKKKERRA
jgi:hypothetical protein